MSAWYKVGHCTACGLSSSRLGADGRCTTCLRAGVFPAPPKAPKAPEPTVVEKPVIRVSAAKPKRKAKKAKPRKVEGEDL